MTLPAVLQTNFRLPVVAAPLFIISHPPLVMAQCKAGIMGSFPALNARPEAQLDEWLAEITEGLADHTAKNPDRPAAPFAVNQIVHRSNKRLEHDLTMCVKYKVPVVISSLGAVPEVNAAIHSYGGIVLHDIINNRHAHSAINKGADGLIAVAAGAGGHAGPLSPFALVQEIREWFDGPLLLSGSIANGGAILAAQAMGADMAYIGSPFIATDEARATDDYKQMIVDSEAKDIVYSNFFTGFRATTSSLRSPHPALIRTISLRLIRPRWISTSRRPDPRPGRKSGAPDRVSARSRRSARCPNSSTGWKPSTRPPARAWRCKSRGPSRRSGTRMLPSIRTASGFAGGRRTPPMTGQPRRFGLKSAAMDSRGSAIMDFQTAVRTCFQKYATISGRARRSEYWWFALFLLIGNVVLNGVDAILFGGDTQLLSAIFSLATIVPSVCAGGRRLHDTGRSAWWLLIGLIPLVGFLVLLWWFVQKGTDGSNEYGPDPLAGERA
jgi:nitronate monooxygenase